MTSKPLLLHGDCRDALDYLPSDSIDAIVTDPPYGLSFMGKGWDYDVPGVEVWREVFRVLKPGGHLLAFFGTRTYHRGVIPIEDAGFEIRDQIGWAYGSGFPKSLDVSKAIDKQAGAEREVVGTEKVRDIRNGHGRAQGEGINAADRDGPVYMQRELTAPATAEAQRWQGWGTALKPAWEPIVLARKPLIGTVADNVLQHGTGALNIDGCRVETGETIKATRNVALGSSSSGIYGAATVPGVYEQKDGGRWPANLIHDGSPEVLAAFPQTASGGAPTAGDRTGNVLGKFAARSLTNHGASAGSAARFFYCAKAGKKDRDEGLEAFAEQPHVQFQTANGTSGKASSISEGRETAYRNTHPTVKPTDLMRYLCRLVTPPNGTVLDPFMGSGSTGKAAMLEGFQFVGIEREAEYLRIAEARIEHARIKALPPVTPFDFG